MDPLSEALRIKKAFFFDVEHVVFPSGHTIRIDIFPWLSPIRFMRCSFLNNHSTICSTRGCFLCQPCQPCGFRVYSRLLEIIALGALGQILWNICPETQPWGHTMARFMCEPISISIYWRTPTKLYEHVGHCGAGKQYDELSPICGTPTWQSAALWLPSWLPIMGHQWHQISKNI